MTRLDVNVTWVGSVTWNGKTVCDSKATGAESKSMEGETGTMLAETWLFARTTGMHTWNPVVAVGGLMPAGTLLHQSEVGDGNARQARTSQLVLGGTTAMVGVTLQVDETSAILRRTSVIETQAVPETSQIVIGEMSAIVAGAKAMEPKTEAMEDEMSHLPAETAALA